jgi:hypothetical protein
MSVCSILYETAEPILIHFGIEIYKTLDMNTGIFLLFIFEGFQMKKWSTLIKHSQHVRLYKTFDS